MANNNKTPFLGLTTPATGDYNWGAEINKNFIKLDQVYGGLQSSMEGLETTERQDGFFNFIKGQEYLILNSMRVGDNVNAAVLFPNTSPNTSTYKGSEFFIAGTVKQSPDMEVIEFKTQVCYCTTLNKNTFPDFTDGAKTGISFEGNYAILQVHFSPTGDYTKQDGRLESYRIKIDIGENSNLKRPEQLEKLKKALIGETIVPTYQLPNNTAFYVTVPARGYNNETTSTLYNKTAIYYERQLVIKYTDVGAVIFTSLNNTTGGVYVPQKEVTSNAIHFVRRPITDTSQSVNAYVDPWYVYGGTWDISDFDGSIQQPLGIWTKKADQNYYYTYIPKLGVDASDKGTKSYSIDFYKKVYESSPNQLELIQGEATQDDFAITVFASSYTGNDGTPGSINCSGKTNYYLFYFLTSYSYPAGTYTFYMPTMNQERVSGYKWVLYDEISQTNVAEIDNLSPSAVAFTIGEGVRLTGWIEVRSPDRDSYIEYPMLIQGDQTNNLPPFSPYSTTKIYRGTLDKVLVEYEITNMTTLEQNLSELRVFGLMPEQIKQLMGRVTYAKETITGATDTAKLLEGLKAYVDKRISESVIQVINSDV